jgi:PKD repeat protein
MRIAYLRALAGLLAAATTFALPASMAGARRAVPLSTHVSGLRPAPSVHGGGSPFHIAKSDAHGLVRRRESGVVQVAPRSESPSCSVSCPTELVYHGGPVLHGPVKYSLYWEPSSPTSNGQAGTTFTPFPERYESLIDSFLANVASASGTLGNVYSVDGQYSGGGPGEYRSTFGEGLFDSHAYPPRNLTTCPPSVAAKDHLPPATQPCISDTETETESVLQIPEEIVRFMNEYNAAHPTKPLPMGLGAIYYVFTPDGVNSCSGEEGGVPVCNTNAYCAYHSAFLVEPGKQIVVYANMPYDAVPGCNTPAEPNGNPADAEIGTVSHEDNEAITDPLGSAWFDSEGEEVADKCTFPFFDPAEDANEVTDAYGPLLEGSFGSTAFNQLIDGGHYLLQREWSDAAGGCVTQAPVPTASFSAYPSAGTAGQPVAFNGSASTTPAGALTSYSWSFGDGSAEADGPQPSHAYASPGTYTVRLTVANDSGATASTAQNVSVAPSAPEPIVLTKTVSVNVPVEPVAYTASQLASKLGLPVNGARLSGRHPIAIGHAECPPACTVTARLYAVRHLTVHGRRLVKRVFIGALTTKVAAKSSIKLTLTLNATGRKLLGKSRKLRAQLLVSVTGREGGSWHMTRRVTLTR